MQDLRRIEGAILKGRKFRAAVSTKKGHLMRNAVGVGSTPRITAKERELPPNLHGLILTGRGGTIRDFKRYLPKNIDPTDPISKLKIPTKKVDQEMVNRISHNHEIQELAVSKKTKNIFFSHGSPNVLLSENNLLASLPKENKAAKLFFSTLRNISGEEKAIRNAYPGYTHGKTKLSPAARKHILKNIEVGRYG